MTQRTGIQRRGLQVGYVGAYLMFIANALRAIFWYAGGIPDEGSAGNQPYGLFLGLYALLLFSEPWLTPRLYPAPGRLRSWYPILYLVVQTGMIVVLSTMPPYLDFLPILFVPLSMQAGLWFDRRGALAWTGGFGLLTTGLLLMDWGLLRSAGVLQVQGDEWTTLLAMALMYGTLCFLVVGYARRMRQAQAARAENERLLGELQQAHHQLQDYAVQVESLAVAEERGRLARDLHDSVTQTLFSMNLSVQAVRTLLDKDPLKATGQLDRLQELARSAVAEIQLLVSELRPRTMAEEGLLAALRRHVAERQSRDGLLVDFVVVGEERTDLSEAVVAGLYRIVQEALNNVVKHAGTREAQIRLDLSGTPACIEVTDRGVGFDTAAAAGRAGHVGLAGMAERGRQIGWQVTVEAQLGGGTRVRVEEVP